MPTLHVVRPGLLTTIQDRGRWGRQSWGVPVAGPMDPSSHRVANALTGNAPGLATLEVTLVGPELVFDDERIVAIAGAKFELTLDGHPVPIGAPFVVGPGSRLRLGPRVTGARAYLAVDGGIAVAPVFGSRATDLVSRMGGIEGRALVAGDRLALGERDPLRRSPAHRAVPAVPAPGGPARLRVVRGPNHTSFATDALERLQSSPYVITNNSDRMGFRLNGPALPPTAADDFISDATTLGALQVPASGQPILLMADRQTTGGYPKVATVISADISIAGQLGPGDALSFVVCSRREAMAALIAQERALMALEGVADAVSGVGGPLRAAFGDRARPHVPLGPLTTFRVGGPADWLVETESADEIVLALAIANRAGVMVTILGGGSNVLVADGGVRGLVIRPRRGKVCLIDGTRVRADAAITINGLVRWTINHGCSGLEAWAGTPGTVGGAIFGNAHFGGRSIGELVTNVRVASRSGVTTEIPRSAMAFAYDRSRLQETREVLLSADFAIGEGDPAALRRTARESLAFRKRTQPLDISSAGCVFQNPEPGRDAVPVGMPWSAGALVDRAGLKNSVAGGARISPVHGNFIVNDGTASARDIRALIDRCRAAVRDRYGVELREEIVYLGDFEP